MARSYFLHALSVMSFIRRSLAHRSGITLVELLIVMAILSIVGVSVLPLLFSTTENRLYQQTAAIVEQNGVQILQNIAYRIQNAELILAPLRRSSGSVLMLQTSSGALDPTIIGVSTGELISVRKSYRQTISSSQVAIEDFRVRNTSSTGALRSVNISFIVSRVLRLQQPHVYSQLFEASFTLPYKDNNAQLHGCNVTPPSCSNRTYTWRVYESFNCFIASTPLDC